MNKKHIMAQLFIEALKSCCNLEAVEDALWLMSNGIGDEEEQVENFDKIFQECFDISYQEAATLNLF